MALGTSSSSGAKLPPVDTEWAIQQLEEWIELAERLDRCRLTPAGQYTPPGVWKEVADELRDRHAMILEILERAKKGLGAQALLRERGSGAPTAGPGLTIVRHALGLLRRRDEMQEKLGPQAPQMRADYLHPLVWGAAEQLWSDGHHGQAVQRAATFVSAHLAALLARHDVSDSGLMQQAFSANPPVTGQPRLRWPGDPTDLTVKSMNEGLRLFAPGCFLTIRNPATHSTDVPERQEAFEHLAALSALMRWIDQCDVITN
jgi:hypothetical protein